MISKTEHIPPGTMMLWAGGAVGYKPNANGAIAADGWLYCDGQTIPQGLYPTLFEAIGTAYNIGTEPLGTFRLPGIADYMNKGLPNIINVNRISTPATTHSHTAGTVTAPTVNYGAAYSLNHDHNFGANTSSTGNTHSHGNNAGTSNNSAGNVNRAAGTANQHLQGHAHNAATSSSAGGGGHNHTFGANRATSAELHSHNNPGVNVAFNANVSSASHANGQPLIAMWHIIKT